MFSIDDSDLKAAQEQNNFNEVLDGQTDGRTAVFNVRKMHSIDYVTGFLLGLNSWRNELVERQTNPNLNPVDDCPF